MAKDFDIFNGGIKDLRKYVEEQKEKVKVMESQLLDDATTEIMDNVQKNANNILMNDMGIDEQSSRELNHTYSQVASNNELEKVSSNHRKIFNTSEEATYAEFGTGVIGKGSPYPNNALGWQYDVNEHGERGWRYIGQSGTLVRTLGYPAYATYHISFEDFKNDLEELSIKTFKGVFTNEN